MSRRVLPTNNCTSHMRNGVDSEGPDVYSPGRRRKKKANTIMSAIADVAGLPEAVPIPIMWRIIDMGTCFTRLGTGSYFLYAAYMRWSLKSIV